MAISFEDIEKKFQRVFGFIQRDLEHFFAQDAGGNFALATLAACACETLVRYRYGSGDGGEVFGRLLSAEIFTSSRGAFMMTQRGPHLGLPAPARIRTARSLAQSTRYLSAP